MNFDLNSVYADYCDRFPEAFGSIQENRNAIMVRASDDDETFVHVKTFCARFAPLYGHFDLMLPSVVEFAKFCREYKTKKEALPQHTQQLNILPLYCISYVVYLKCCRVLNRPIPNIF